MYHTIQFIVTFVDVQGEFIGPNSVYYSIMPAPVPRPDCSLPSAPYADVEFSLPLSLPPLSVLLHAQNSSFHKSFHYSCLDSERTALFIKADAAAASKAIHAVGQVIDEAGQVEMLVGVCTCTRVMV